MAFAEHGEQIACLITEAAAGNMGAVAPLPGFNQALAQICREHGALFVSDEVMTGFRVSYAGHWGLDGAREGWTPDLMTFGKVMGGGFPAAAFGGRADVMAHLAPTGPVYQAGTLSGNPIATTAGLTTLRLADADVYARLDATAATIQALVRDALDDAGVPHVVQAAGNLFSCFFVIDEGATEVRNFDEAGRQELHRFTAFFHAMLDAGVYLPPSAFEAWFVSAAHDDRRHRPDRLRPAREPPAPPPTHDPKDPRDHRLPARPSSTCCATARSTTPTGILYGRLPDYHLSELGRKMADRVAETLTGRDITHLVVVAARAGPGDGAAVGRRARARHRHRRRG